jgi:hypothetical protein
MPIEESFPPSLAKIQAQSLRLSNSAACRLENGYMFLKYVLSQGLGELAAGHDSRNEPQSNALLRTTLRHLAVRQRIP